MARPNDCDSEEAWTPMIIAATGHRPEKLGGYTHEVRVKLMQVATEYLAFQPRVSEVVSGMALGWDQAFAHAAMNLRLPVVAAVPFKAQAARWPVQCQAYYRKLLHNCDRVVNVSDRYHEDAFQERNEWMVDYSHRLAALWNRTPGGTANCVGYAMILNRPIDHLWKDFQCIR